MARDVEKDASPIVDLMRLGDGHHDGRQPRQQNGDGIKMWIGGSPAINSSKRVPVVHHYFILTGGTSSNYISTFA